MEEQVKLPELGDDEDSAEEGEISFWYIEEGESVKEGEDLVEVITDKAAYTIPAPSGGMLKKVLKDEGDRVKPGDDIGVIES